MVSGIPKTVDRFLGYICKTLPEDIAERQLSNVLNISHDNRGSLITRYGYAQIGDMFGDGPAHGLGKLDIVGQTKRRIAFSNGDVYEIEGNVWTKIADSIIEPLSKVEMTQFQNNLFFVDGFNNLQNWDGTNFASIIVPDNPKARYIKLAKNRLFIAGDDSNPSFVWFCSLEDPFDWRDPTTGGTGGVISVGVDDGERITGLEVYADSVIIFKERSIYVLNIDGDPYAGGGTDPEWTLRKSDSVTGCLFGAHRTIKKIGDKILYLSERGVYSFDGYRRAIETTYNFDNFRSFELSEEISTKTLQEQNALIDFDWNDACADYYHNKYILTLKKPYENNYYAFVLDTSVIPEQGNPLGSWMFYDNYRFMTYMLDVDDEGKEILYAGDSTEGKVYLIRRHKPFLDDAGIPIKSEFVSKGFFHEGKQNTVQVRRAQFAYSTGGDYGIFHSMSVDYNDWEEIPFPFTGVSNMATWGNSMWGNFLWGDENKSVVFKEACYPPEKTWGRIARFRWANFKQDNTYEKINPFKFYHFIFNVKPRRQRNQILKSYSRERSVA